MKSAVALAALVVLAQQTKNFSVEKNTTHEDYVPLQGQYDPQTMNGTFDLRDDLGRDIGHVDMFGGRMTIYGPQGEYKGSVTEPSRGEFQYDE